MHTCTRCLNTCIHGSNTFIHSCMHTWMHTSLKYMQTWLKYTHTGIHCLDICNTVLKCMYVHEPFLKAALHVRSWRTSKSCGSRSSNVAQITSVSTGSVFGGESAEILGMVSTTLESSETLGEMKKTEFWRTVSVCKAKPGAHYCQLASIHMICLDCNLACIK